MIYASRYHDISCGHRVAGHENKCAHLHGHNYRIYFHCRGGARSLDALGRVLDFSVIKARCCMWIEQQWDHRMLLWEQDELMVDLCRHVTNARHAVGMDPVAAIIEDSIVWTPFNPTAENMAEYLLAIGPSLLGGTGVELFKVDVEETRKCSATAMTK